MMGLTMCKT